MSAAGPQFPLKTVADLARDEKVSFTVRAERDYRALGYDRAHALDCIKWLDPGEFQKSIYYQYTDKWWDVYLTKHRGPDGIARELYVKLRIPSPSCVDQVAVTSFHTQAPY